MLKKFLIYAFTVTLLFGVGFFGTTFGYKHYHKVSPAPSYGNPAYVQVRASHMLLFLGDDGDPVGVCSGTVIGKHAILTAAHCNERANTSKTLKIDRSTRTYNILAGSFDGRDHVIMLLDGPEFKDVAPYVVRAPKVGEPIYVEGFGNEVYPAEQKAGRITGVYDPSEVDAGQQIFYFNAAIIHGDSGSAVFGADGAILGVVTWHMDDLTGAGYELDYPSEIIHVAQTFEGIK